VCIDREPGRHRNPDPGHLGQVRALAAERLLVVFAPLGVAVAEVEHVLAGHCIAPRWYCEVDGWARIQHSGRCFSNTGGGEGERGARIWGACRAGTICDPIHYACGRRPKSWWPEVAR